MRRARFTYRRVDKTDTMLGMVAIVLDFETGGLNPFQHAVLQVGYCALDSNDPPVCHLVREPVLTDETVSTRALEITGLRMATVHAEGYSVRDTAVQLARFIDAHRSRGGWCEIWCHNAPFDAAFMARLFHLADMPAPEKTLFMCSLQTARTMRRAGLINCQRLTLSDVYRAVTGEPMCGAHDAGADVAATRVIINEMAAILDAVRDAGE